MSIRSESDLPLSQFNKCAEALQWRHPLELIDATAAIVSLTNTQASIAKMARMKKDNETKWILFSNIYGKFKPEMLVGCETRSMIKSKKVGWRAWVGLHSLEWVTLCGFYEQTFHFWENKERVGTQSHFTSSTHLTWGGWEGRKRVWLHPQPIPRRHLFHGRCFFRSARTLLEPGTDTSAAATQALSSPPAAIPPPPPPRMESIHCCSRSYYRYAPAKCKTSICHLSARCTMKTSHYAVQLPASCTSHGFGCYFGQFEIFFWGKKKNRRRSSNCRSSDAFEWRQL